MIELKEWYESEARQAHIQAQQNERAKKKGNKDEGKWSRGGGGDNTSNTSNKKQKRLIKRKVKQMIAASVTQQAQKEKDTTASKTHEINIKSMISGTLSEFTEKSAAISSTTIAAKKKIRKLPLIKSK